jgi:uncharacterized membrane protein YsdA (DUF1294 family)
VVPEFTGRILEWDPAKGCGWVESGGQRIFLHWRDFAERRKRPAVGDVIRFSAGTGPTGLLCAQKAVHLNDGGRFGFGAGLLLLALLVLPAFAIAKLQVDERIAGSYAVVTSILAYVVYAFDKARARAKQWRTREATLHFLELIGGWPGAFIAQRRLRHKCSKVGYQVVFWSIVAFYQYVAFGFLQGWELPKGILRTVRDVWR